MYSSRKYAAVEVKPRAAEKDRCSITIRRICIYYIVTCVCGYEYATSVRLTLSAEAHLIANRIIMSTYHLVRAAMFGEWAFAVARRPRGIAVVVIRKQ